MDGEYQNRRREMLQQRLREAVVFGATDLNLAGFGLTVVPDAVLTLTNLTTLDLSRNELTALPAAIGNLAALTTLNLSRNELTALPESLGNLAALDTLHLSRNRLTALPAAVGDLTALTELYLHSNQLTALPEALGDLAALTTLHLSRNRLTALPEALGRLAALTTLSAANNHLALLPEAIGNLTALTALYLHDNQLVALPDTLRNLSHLKTLYLHGNDRLGLSPEVLGPGWRETKFDGKLPADPRTLLRFYFTNKTQPRRPLAAAKVLVVGQGSVGKTSLVKYWLTGKACDGSEAKTTKIDISHTALTVPCPDGTNSLDVALNVWDFGGQEIYHATHQFFLSKRSLYLLVLDARLTEGQNNIHYWFQVIRSYGAESPVLVVVNKSDEHHLELNETRLKKEYGEQFAGVERVSCKSPSGRDDLTRAIRKHLAGMKHVFDSVPDSYFEVKAALEKKAKKENFLEYAEYEKLCKKKRLRDALDQTTLIRFLHDLGVVLNFNDDKNPYKLQHTAILNPEWVTRGVYALLNDHRLAQDHGKLTREHLNRIFSDDEYPADKRDVIIGMMHRFELCFAFPGAANDRWLIPGMLYPEEPDLAWNEHTSLNFQYHYGVLPIGLISRFIVRMHTLVANETYWQSGTVLDIDGNRVLVRGDTAKGRVFVTIQGAAGGRRAALAVVRHQFRDLHATIPGLVVAGKVPLPDNPDVVEDFDHLLKLEAARRTEHWPAGADRMYKLGELLDGVTTPKERDDVRRQGDIHNHFPGVTTVNQNPGGTNINFNNSPVTNSVLNWGAISGNVTNLVKQLPAKREDGPDLKAVLDAFLAALRDAAEKQQLPADDAKDAIKDVEVIAEAATRPKEPEMLEKANTAVRALGRIVKGVAALAGKATELGTTVTGWFG